MQQPIEHIVRRAPAGPPVVPWALGARHDARRRKQEVDIVESYHLKFVLGPSYAGCANCVSPKRYWIRACLCHALPARQSSHAQPHLTPSRILRPALSESHAPEEVLGFLDSRAGLWRPPLGLMQPALDAQQVRKLLPISIHQQLTCLRQTSPGLR